MRDRQLGLTERLSVGAGALQGNGWSEVPSISADGRSVTFTSGAMNLVFGDTNGLDDVFVRDRQLGLTERVSVGAGTLQGNGWSEVASISADGRSVAFASGATNLVSGDTNGRDDVFVRDRGPVLPIVYCTAGTTTHGCAATIAGTGTPSASAGSGFTLSASSIEGQKQGLFFYGLDNAGFAPSPWGPGTSWLCVKPSTQRTPMLSSGGTANLCDGNFALDWNAYIAANAGALGNPFSAGQHVFAQAWFRDPPAPKSTNLSNAFEFVVEL